jgi:hypothetical protein
MTRRTTGPRAPGRWIMKTLVYLSFGGRTYSDEASYAILSALHEIGPDLNEYRIVVITDDAAAFAGLPVLVEPVDQATLADWAGPCGYIYRRKVCAIREALRKFGGSLTFCDTDTYFLKHPRKLFARIRPGHTVMHLFEGSPIELRVHALAQLLRSHEFSTLAGERWKISPDTPIINSGVIGIHEADARLLDEVLNLVDQLCPQLDYFGTEQFAFSACLARYSTLRYAHDVVHHYWPPAGRERFHEHLAVTLHDTSIGSSDERFSRLFRVRERLLDRPESIGEHLHVALWTLLNQTGTLEIAHQMQRWIRRHDHHHPRA